MERRALGLRCVAMAAGGVIALLESSAFAQITRLVMEASVDAGRSWGGSVEAGAGSVVYFRMRAQLVGGEALGLRGMTYQPILTNFVAGQDEFVPFTFPGLRDDGSASTEAEYWGRHVAAEPSTNTGRIFPFGFTQSTATAYPVHHVDPGNVLRFANQNATTPTANIYWGMSSTQMPAAWSGTLFDGSLDVVVFRYAVRFNAQVDSPRVAWPSGAGLVVNNMARWYLNEGGTSLLNALVAEMVPAVVVPAPGVGGLVACGMMIAARRRRR